MKKIKNGFLNNLSLKKKWTLSTAIVIFISYAAICTVIYFALYTWLLQNEQNNAVRTVDDFTSILNEEGTISIQQLKNDTGLLKAIVNQNQTVRIFNLDGYEVFRINHENSAVQENLNPGNSNGKEVVKTEIDGQDVFVVNQLVSIGPFTGVLQLIHPLDTFQSMMKYVFTTMLIAGIGAIVMAGFIGFHLANFFIRPLQDLRDSMLSVRKKGFEGKIDFSYPSTTDEIGDLISIYELMMEDLHNSFQKQQQFVSDASHELRTPIQAIEGHLTLIKRWGKNNPEVLEESLNTAIDEVVRMKKIIEELLELARNKKREHDSYTNTMKVVSSVKDELEMIYPNAVIHVVEEGEVKQPNITENALAQILRNIVENGIRYNENKPIITISIRYYPNKLRIDVEDNGIGIAKEHLPHIFDRFYRVDSSRENTGGGTGLGLSITKMLAEKYQVKLDVISYVGKGTVFTLIFEIK